MKRPVLVLGAEPRIAVTIARSLHRRGIPTDIGVLTASEPRVRSRAVRQFLRFPSLHDSSDDFLGTLREQIRSQGYDVLIPCSDSTLTACMAHYEQLSELLYVACPPPQTTGRILNKQMTLQAAERCRIRFPRTYRLRSPEELEAMRDTLCFPLIAKPAEKLKVGAFKTRGFQSFAQLEQAFVENPEFGMQNLIQEHCKGVGVGVEMLMHRGEAVALFQHRRLKELPATGGVSVLAIAEELDPRLVEMSVRLLRELDWYGVAMVEFLYDAASDEATLMEVNGRYWGSIALATHAGVDFPGLHWQVIHGERPDALPAYRRGLRARWLTGDLLRLYSLFFPSATGAGTSGGRWKEVARFVGDFRPGTRDMIWSWRDPAPAFAELVREVRHMVATIVRGGVARVMPRILRKRLRTYQGLEADAGSWYVKRQLGRMLGTIRDGSRRIPAEVRSVVCVCHGNIIRSPFAAVQLSSFLGTGSHISVFSAGLHAQKGNPADGRARRAAMELGVSLDGHCAEPFTAEMAERAELILVMDFQGEAEMLSRFPHASSKVFLLGALPSKCRYSSLEIADPYEGDLTDVRRCYRRVQGHIKTVADILTSKS
jgi:predicted ATP-grasp superfamily ATP-dependent carboligase/protein-tyrosine-phosphatase